MARKKGGSKSGSKKGKKASTLNDMKFGIGVLHGEVVLDSANGNGYTKRNGKKIKWAITEGLEFKLDFNLLPCADLGGSTVWPFDSPRPVNGNSTGWVTSFKGDPGDPGVYKYDVQVRDAITKVPVARMDPVIIVGRV